MVRTKLMPKKGERGEEGAPDEGGAEGVSCKGKEASFPSAPPIPSQKALTLEGGGEDGGRG